MTTLHVIVDQIIAPIPGGIGRYARELARQLIATAPPGFGVAGIVSAPNRADLATIAEALPGLTELRTTPLRRRELALAWQHGVALPSNPGMIHATSLLAPLNRRGRGSSRQTAVTIHDAVPWTHPETLTPRGVAWHRAMAARADRYSDAIVVPTHAVAAQLDGFFAFGDRIRVIGGGTASSLVLTSDADARAERMRLPDRFILAVGTREPRKGLDSLIGALGLGIPADVPLIIAGASGWGGVDASAIAADAGIPGDRVRALGRLDDADVAVLLDRASVLVQPSLAEGFGLPLIEAFAFGTPVVHSDAPALVEVAGGAGLVVPLTGKGSYPARLAEAVTGVLGDSRLARRLASAGSRRAKQFSWRESAEAVWQLHTELAHRLSG